MSDWLAIIILGIIEGITEFLPISSTGHLLIAEHWLPRQSDLFNIVIQSGAVVAVIPLFWHRFDQAFRHWREPGTQAFLLKIFTAFAITGAGGVLLDKLHFELPETVVPVAIALVAGGIAFLVVAAGIDGKPARGELTWTVVVAVGLGQLLAAVFPGTSRSGSTILLMLLLGLGRPAATEFSFLVGIPTMLAAGSLKIFKALHHPAAGASPEAWDRLLVATLVSAAVSFIVVKWLLRYVQTHSFRAFGWYRIALGTVLLAAFR